MQKDMLNRFLASLGGGDGDLQSAEERFLSDVLGEIFGAQGEVESVLLLTARFAGNDSLACHRNCFNVGRGDHKGGANWEMWELTDRESWAYFATFPGFLFADCPANQYLQFWISRVSFRLDGRGSVVGHFRSSFMIASLVFGCASAAEAQIYSILHNFAPVPLSPEGPDDGEYPIGSLTQAGSSLYGYSLYSRLGGGAIIQYNLNTAAESVAYDFNSPTGPAAYAPAGTPLLSGTILYGMSEVSTPGYGAIFQYDLATNQESTLYTFSGHPNDGELPYGSLIQSGNILYGLTSEGGAINSNPRGGSGRGTIFQYDLATHTETLLHSFGATGDGATPEGTLIQDGSMLYGTTTNGGAFNAGTLFQYDLSTNTESVLYSFPEFEIGFAPDLVRSGSKLYGAAAGTLFQYDLSTNIESTLYTFGTNPNDVGSDGSLTLSGSTLYGAGGGIFSFDLNTDTETILHTFSADGSEGQSPYGPLLISGSTLYGMTYQGGTNNTGVIFALTIPEPASASLLAISSIALLAQSPSRLNRPHSTSARRNDHLCRRHRHAPGCERGAGAAIQACVPLVRLAAAWAGGGIIKRIEPRVTSRADPEWADWRGDSACGTGHA